MLNNKKGNLSFGTIVAIIGSVLIAVGIAWLIAQNWHQIGSALKIIILLAATSSAYIAGTFFCIKGYNGIGKALFVLGALLYTLSIFLIAQIFSTKTTFQGTAWLFLLAWTGVFLVSYIFDSSISLVIGLIEFVIWLIIQFLAFMEVSRDLISPGILVFYLLATGILLYGLNLIHSANKHKFGRIYKFWTAFYFLAFTYSLTFQTLLPTIWPSEAKFSLTAIIFLIVLSLISVIFFVYGIALSTSKKAIDRNEVVGIVLVLILLSSLIGLTYFTSNKMGVCRNKSCYDLKSETECKNIHPALNCEWNDINKFCSEKSCHTLKTQTDCENKFDNSNCKWTDYGRGYECTFVYCYNIDNQAECENNNCYWGNEQEGRLIRGVNLCMIPECLNFRTSDECNKFKGKNNKFSLDCEWNERYNYCSVKKSCSQYDNNYKMCKENVECSWNTNSFFFFDWRSEKVPLIVWVVWIIINIVFLLIILGIIGYGTWKKLPKIINLGIRFFALDIITRYIGFIMDLWGYTSLSLIFISGGIILLLGGWAIEKWRRKLIAKTR